MHLEWRTGLQGDDLRIKNPAPKFNPAILGRRRQARIFCSSVESMLTIEGSLGEGGGQILRTSLSLSLVTGQAFGIEKIRAGRQKPGLQHQHLAAVTAAAAIGQAEVEGAAVGSQMLVFRPRGVMAGEYSFSIGTAGSAALVLQTVLPALVIAASPSALVLEGGTHNPLAP